MSLEEIRRTIGEAVRSTGINVYDTPPPEPVSARPVEYGPWHDVELPDGSAVQVREVYPPDVAVGQVVFTTEDREWTATVYASTGANGAGEWRLGD